VNRERRLPRNEADAALTSQFGGEVDISTSQYVPGATCRLSRVVKGIFRGLPTADVAFVFNLSRLEAGATNLISS
jgi:hypothetical protein